ncbi:hypothetical protein HII36_33615 [Nonomuraea sp. NN258]|uniref:hypothetical protein n=1 Tax=Nonomuraea antri TaxID=2730852 RepID=UPI001C2C79D0|nr:hypothetical protein [Nonomuraea antri]NRQ36739.1 hypothetical protein [Nonomuraea antri]
MRGFAMPLQIVNPEAGYGRVELADPAPSGYLHVGGHVRPRPPFMPMNRGKLELFRRLHRCAQRLRARGDVKRVSLFDALAMPPFARLPYVRDRRESVHLPRFDVAVLVETASPEAAHEVRGSAPYHALRDELATDADDTHELLGRNARRIGDVERTRRGVYLFNHFVADDADVALGLWDYLAAWYVRETGLTNSVLMVPEAGEKADYVAINHAHWDEGLAKVMLRQLTSPGFGAFVRANLDANRVGAMPVLYRLVA